jgi:hypothetical protein
MFCFKHSLLWSRLPEYVHNFLGVIMTLKSDPHGRTALHFRLN